MKVQRLDWWWLGGILLLAFVLRAYKLDTGLWYDEIITLVNSVRLPTSELLTTYTSLNSHVLFSLEAQTSIALFGESAWSLRLPALIFGVASVGALWWLARLVMSPWEAHLAALLMTVSYHHVWFSQNARGYTGLLFWSLLATVIFIRNMQRSSWSSWVGYACVLVAAVYTHLTAAFFFAAQGIVYAALIVRNRLGVGAGLNIGRDLFAEVAGLKPLLGFLLGGVLVFAVYAPMLPTMMETFGKNVLVPSVATVAVAEWKTPIWTVLEIARSLQELGFIMSFGLPLALILITIGALNLTKNHPIFAAFYLIHIPLTLGILLALSFNIWPRFFFIDAGFILISLVRGVFVVTKYIARILRIRERWRVSDNALGIFITGVGILISLFLLLPNYRYPKQDFVGARDFVESSRTENDKVASFGLASEAFSQYYAPDWEVVDTKAQLDRLRAGRRAWLVYSFPKHAEVNYPHIMENISADFDLIKSFQGTLGNGEVLVYRSRQ